MSDEKPLDLTKLRRVMTRLTESLDAYGAEPDNAFNLDSVVKRFEYTFEVTRKFLRRYLINRDPKVAQIPHTELNQFVELGLQARVLKGNWGIWRRLRDARNLTSHDYGEEKVREVTQAAWPMLEEATFLYNALAAKFPQEDRMAKIDIATEVLTTVKDTLSQYAPGRPAYIFGSRATGLAQPDSDLDLAVGGDPAMSSDQVSDLRCALEDMALPFEVDVLNLHEAKGIFRKRIEEEWVPIAEAEPQTTARVTA